MIEVLPQVNCLVGDRVYRAGRRRVMLNASKSDAFPFHQNFDLAAVLRVRSAIYDFYYPAVGEHICARPAGLVCYVYNRAFAIDSVSKQQQILLCMDRSNTALLLD